MIKSLTVINDRNERIKINLSKPWETGLLIEDIDGLGPPEMTINKVDYALTDGSRFNTARANSRSVTVNIRFYGKKSIEDIRRLTYKYFSIKKQIMFIVETDKKAASAIGYVESNSPNIFSPEEGTTISIIFPDPWFYDTEEKTIYFYEVESLFEFEFENNSLTQPLIEFGNKRKDLIKHINYTGDVETGFVFLLHFYGPIRGDIHVYRLDSSDQFLIHSEFIESIIGSSIQNGDYIAVNTGVGHKEVLFCRDNLWYNIMNCIHKQSAWLYLSHGDNSFSYAAGDGTTDYTDNMSMEIRYIPVYEGI